MVRSELQVFAESHNHIVRTWKKSMDVLRIWGTSTHILRKLYQVNSGQRMTRKTITYWLVFGYECHDLRGIEYT